MRATVQDDPHAMTAPAAGYRFAQALKGNKAIWDVERVELELRGWLARQVDSVRSLADACSFVMALAEIGLLRKYKPYAIKAANPAGYSLFLLRDGQGFSFQRHIESKYEIFHILQVQRTRGGQYGYVFLCAMNEWRELFSGRDIASWILDPSGAPQEFRARCFRPTPGDLFYVDSPDIVHTVIGCHLEEFATSSCDRVDRLFDQNARNRRKTGLDQARNAYRLAKLPPIFPKRRIRYDAGRWYPEPLQARETAFGREYELSLGEHLRATFLEILGDPAIGRHSEEDRVTAITVRAGSVGLDIRLGGAGSTASWASCVDLMPAGSTIVPPGFDFRIRRLGDTPSVVSVHSVRTKTAFR